MAFTRRSLATCRDALAERINGVTPFLTDAVAPDSLSVVSSQLALALNDTNRYRNQWVYILDGAQAGQTRHVGDLSLTTSSGQLKVGPVAYAAPIQNGVNGRVYKRLPPTSMAGFTGLRECLNMALRELWVVDRLSVAAVTGQPSYDLGSLFGGLADWLDPQAIVEFYGPQIAAGLNIIPWSGWNAIQDAESVQLQVAPGLTSGQTATLEITRPANTYIEIGGVWTDNQDGFTADTDECLFRPEVLAEVALVYAYTALERVSEGPQKAEWAAERQNQRRLVDGLKLQMLPHPDQRPGPRRPVTAILTWPGDPKSGWV